MDKVPILFIIAPLLLSCMSERLNFHQSKAATWDEARQHCQVCYKELVTVRYDNSLALVQGLKVKGQHWIGLRETLGADPWSGWANGDPITFQNWYPVKPQPVVETTTAITAVPKTSTSGFTQTPSNDTLKTSFTQTPSNDTLKTSFTQTPSNDTLKTSFTQTPSNDTLKTSFTQAPSNDTLKTTFTITAVPETSGFTQTYYDVTTSLKTTEYVREFCVAMLHSGLWVEDECAKKLPYICYDDRFYGKASVDRRATTATLSWSIAPGNITSYRVEVQGGVNLNDSVTNTTYELFNMTPGTLYAVRVFPVKCDRELNSQNISFITKPETPQNLTMVNITERSVFLSWDRPVGNLQSYCVKVGAGPCQSTREEQATVPGLIPGGRYVVYVLSVTGDVFGEPANITVLTRPSQVTGLTVSGGTNRSLTLSWSHGGNATGYKVVAEEIRNNTPIQLFQSNVSHAVRQVKVTGAPPGTHLWLTVWAVAHGDVEGEGVMTDSFIAPDPVPSLDLYPTENSIRASWPPPDGSYQLFRVSVQLQNSTNTTHYNTSTTSVALLHLFAAAKYKVTVSTLAGNLISEPVVNCTYTDPVKPEGVKVTYANASHATLEWTTPNTAPTTEHLVTYHSSFWNYRDHASLPGGKTSLTVGGLRPGSRYVFEVFTVSGGLQSKPVNYTHYTPGEESEVTLSMICSSTDPLTCDKKATKEEVLKELKTLFNTVLDGVTWKLKLKER